MPLCEFYMVINPAGIKPGLTMLCVSSMKAWGDTLDPAKETGVSLSSLSLLSLDLANSLDSLLR
jgi:hypothetical protein